MHIAGHVLLSNLKKGSAKLTQLSYLPVCLRAKVKGMAEKHQFLHKKIKKSWDTKKYFCH